MDPETEAVAVAFAKSVDKLAAVFDSAPNELVLVALAGVRATLPETAPTNAVRFRGKDFDLAFRRFLGCMAGLFSSVDPKLVEPACQVFDYTCKVAATYEFPDQLVPPVFSGLVAALRANLSNEPVVFECTRAIGNQRIRFRHLHPFIRATGVVAAIIEGLRAQPNERVLRASVAALEKLVGNEVMYGAPYDQTPEEHVNEVAELWVVAYPVLRTLPRSEKTKNAAEILSKTMASTSFTAHLRPECEARLCDIGVPVGMLWLFAEYAPIGWVSSAASTYESSTFLRSVHEAPEGWELMFKILRKLSQDNSMMLANMLKHGFRPPAQDFDELVRLMFRHLQIGRIKPLCSAVMYLFDDR